MKSKYKLMEGDNIESLKKIPDNSIDSVVTDPPYGLSFMGKKWDYDVPSVEFWKEVYRVLKPGGHVVSFGGTRTYHRMVVNMEDGGFEIRDQIMWLYGSGFPKSHNIGKAIDKLEGNEREVVGEKTGKINLSATKEGDYDITKGSSPYEGWGTALKPANEPICLARKPLSEKTIAKNVLKWGTGGINIDGCRVGSEEIMTNMKNTKGGLYSLDNKNRTNEVENTFNEGRFPANIILECICDEVIKGEKGEPRFGKPGGHTFGGEVNEHNKNGVGKWPNDKGDIHTNPDCPCRLLDEQSGYLKGDSVNRKPRKGGHREDYIGTDNNKVKNLIEVDKKFNSGGASRFFYQAKVSKKERNIGLEGFEEVGEKEGGRIDGKGGMATWKTKRKNTHPTVKPVALMTYLCRLVTPEGGIVLDPFMGSGSTGIAARLEGFRFVGMEMDPEYIKIADARIKDFEKYREFIK